MLASHTCPRHPLALAVSMALMAHASAQVHAANINDGPQWNCRVENGAWACDQQNPAAVPAQAAKTAAPAAQLDARITSVEATPAGETPPVKLDWYPYPAGQQTGLCPGRYIQPDEILALANDKQAGDTLQLDPVIIEALTSSSELGQTTVLEGGVDLRQGARWLQSDYAELDQMTQQIRLSGQVRYREPGLLMTGSEAQSNIQSFETIFANAEYVMHEQHIRGDAQRLMRLEDERIRVESGSFTSCPPGDASWKIAADTIELNPAEGFGRAEHATLRVADVPVFYVPVFYFPIDDTRRSGFLYPDAGYSSEDGLMLAAPYYFNLAPNYDDTLTPRIYTERGLLLENEFRYMNTWSYNVLSTAAMLDDSQAERDRWLLGVDHEGRPFDKVSTLVNINAVSDDDYFEDLDLGLDEVNRETHLDKMGEILYREQNWQLTTRVHSYQTIEENDETPYRKLPQVLLEGQLADQPLWLEAEYLAEAVAFDRPNNDLTGIDKTTGQRYHLQPSVAASMRSSWGYIEPKVKLWHTNYSLDDTPGGAQTSPDVSVPVFSLDSGLVLERETQLFGNNITQTLEPRLYYLHVPDEDQSSLPNFDSAELDFNYTNLFRDNRFTGRDRIGDADQVALGLGSRFYENDGSERARLGIGQAFYFADREVQLENTTPAATDDTSNFAAQAWLRINDSLTFRHDSELDNAGLELVEHNYKLAYEPEGDKRYLELGYRQREEEATGTAEPRQQSDIAFRWPFGPQWQLFGKWQYDLIENDDLDMVLGAEYASCCWKVRVAARRWLTDADDGVSRESNDGIFIQFVLRGLGALGSTTEFIEDMTASDEKDEYERY